MPGLSPELAGGPVAVVAEGVDDVQARALMTEHKNHGGFEQPIWVDAGRGDLDDVAAGECAGEPDCCPPTVRNGMHRIAALARLGAPEITFDESCSTRSQRPRAGGQPARRE